MDQNGLFAPVLAIFFCAYDGFTVEFRVHLFVVYFIRVAVAHEHGRNEKNEHYQHGGVNPLFPSFP